MNESRSGPVELPKGSRPYQTDHDIFNGLCPISGPESPGPNIQPLLNHVPALLACIINSAIFLVAFHNFVD